MIQIVLAECCVNFCGEIHPRKYRLLWPKNTRILKLCWQGLFCQCCECVCVCKFIPCYLVDVPNESIRIMFKGKKMKKKYFNALRTLTARQLWRFVEETGLCLRFDSHTQYHMYVYKLTSPGYWNRKYANRKNHVRTYKYILTFEWIQIQMDKMKEEKKKDK